MLKTRIFILLLVAFLAATFVNAQENNKPKEPTLEETIEFITLKTLQSKFVYGSNSLVAKFTDGCYREDTGFNNISSIEIIEKKLIASQSKHCGTGTKKLIFYLEKIKTISIGSEPGSDKKNYLVFSSVAPMIEVSPEIEYGGEILTIERPTKVELVFSPEDTPKMLKAFNHLFKLLGIKLIEDKF